MKVTQASGFLSGFYVALVVFWISASLLNLSGKPLQLDTFFSGITIAPYNYIFAFAYGLIPLIGGIIGFHNAQKWGFLKSSMGKAVLFLSLGLIAWGYGELIWSYYNFFLNQEVPYPSWADAGFILSYPLWSIGIFYLGPATGVKFGLRKKSGQFLLILFPLIALALSYYFLVIVARNGSFQLEGGLFKIFFDLAYPIGDVIIATMALLIYGLSFKYLGGRFKWPILIIFLGLIVSYFADFAFSYTTTVGTFYNGSWVDLLFATAVFIFSFGVVNLDI